MRAEWICPLLEVERGVGWPKLWDFVLDHGPKCIDGLKYLVRVITFPPHALTACPLSEEEDIPRDSPISHVLNTHSRNMCSSNCNELLSLLTSVTDSDSGLFNYLCSLANIFWFLFYLYFISNVFALYAILKGQCNDIIIKLHHN